jgi:hypothetical protein
MPDIFLPFSTHGTNEGNFRGSLDMEHFYDSYPLTRFPYLFPGWLFRLPPLLLCPLFILALAEAAALPTVTEPVLLPELDPDPLRCRCGSTTACTCRRELAVVTALTTPGGGTEKTWPFTRDTTAGESSSKAVGGRLVA